MSKGRSSMSSKGEDRKKKKRIAQSFFFLSKKRIQLRTNLD